MENVIGNLKVILQEPFNSRGDIWYTIIKTEWQRIKNVKQP